MDSPPPKKFRVSCESTAADSDKCCWILGGNRFENDPVLSDEDYLSALPLDCFREIFDTFELKELEQISLVSQRLYSVADIFKKKLNKEKGHKLVLRQGRNGDFLFLTYLPHLKDTVFLHYTDGNLIEGRGRSSLPDVNDSILIDSSFIKHCEDMFPSEKVCHLIFKETYFHEDFKQSDMKAFLKWVHSKLPDHLTLHDQSITFPRLITADFLRDFASISCVSRSLTTCELTQSHKKLVLDIEMLECLKQFTSLNSLNIVIDTAWLMDLIKARALRRLHGDWSLSTTKRLEKDEIIASLDGCMMYGSKEKRGRLRHCIRNINDQGEEEILATFNRHSSVHENEEYKENIHIIF